MSGSCLLRQYFRFPHFLRSSAEKLTIYRRMLSWRRKQAAGVERVDCSNGNLTCDEASERIGGSWGLFVFFSALFCVYFHGLRDAFQPTLLYTHIDFYVVRRRRRGDTGWKPLRVTSVACTRRRTLHRRSSTEIPRVSAVNFGGLLSSTAFKSVLRFLRNCSNCSRFSVLSTPPLSLANRRVKMTNCVWRAIVPRHCAPL